jgi:predicted PurR-regulated permease PerM
MTEDQPSPPPVTQPVTRPAAPGSAEAAPVRSPEALAVDIAIRLALIGLFVYLALTLLRPFAPILVWAVILTVALHPVYRWLAARLGGRGGLAATLVTLTLFALVLGPVTVLAVSIVDSLEFLARWLAAEALELPPPPPQVATIPVIGQTLSDAWALASSNIEDFLNRYGTRVLSAAQGMLGAGQMMLGAIAGLALSIFGFLAAVVVSGFLYGAGPSLVAATRRFAHRVVGPRGSGFIDLAGATIRNVARGVIGVAFIQSLLVGIGLIVAGVPGAGLLTFAALLLSIVQIGAAPITVPVLIYVWFQYDTLPALLLTLYLIPVGFLDNVLRPILMSQGLPVPMLVILAGVIGGTLGFGLVGLFLGPIALAVFYDLVRFWILNPPEGAPGAGSGPPAS